jgi:hypothetical protein
VSQLVSILAIVILLMSTGISVDAQSTVDLTFPYTPLPADCSVAPRPTAEILGLLGLESATSNVAESGDDVVVGSPTDEVRVPFEDSVVDVIRELAGCISAASPNRIFALFSNTYLSNLPDLSGSQLEDDLLLNAVWATAGEFFRGDENWPETLPGLLSDENAAASSPAAGAVQGSILGIPAIWELGAGKVAAVVSFSGLACFLRCDYALIFAADETTGRYLIDESIELFDLADVKSG